MAKKNWTAENGGSTQRLAISEELLGGIEDIMTDTLRDTSGQDKSPKSLQDIQKHMKDGDEPVEILLGLVSSPLIDLVGRELAKVVTAEQKGKRVVLAIFYDAEWVDGKGIVRSVGK